MAVGERPPRFHLSDDQRVAVEPNDVNLPLGTTQVAFQVLFAAGLKVIRRKFFPAAAQHILSSHASSVEGRQGQTQPTLWLCGNPPQGSQPEGCGAGGSVAQVVNLGQGQFLTAGQFLDIDVLERDDADTLDEAGGPVDVPHPGVLQGQVEVDLAVGAAGLQVHVVGKVETPLG